MKVTVLFSGGKDSALTSILLEPFFDVELVTFSYNHGETWRAAKKAAEMLGHPHRTIFFQNYVLEIAIEMLLDTGYPKDALNYVHKRAVEKLAQESEFVADGIKREDRAPVMNLSEIRSLEDRFGTHYIRPLAGYGSKTINALASRYLEFEMHPSEDYPASDFEVGLRQALEERRGPETVNKIFPAHHTHSMIIRRKDFE
ncbi:MAG: DUF7411 family protein [Methanotrichaceae archaeon]